MIITITMIIMITMFIMITMIKIIIIAGAWYLCSDRAAVQFFRSAVSICGGGKIRVTLSKAPIVIIINMSYNNVIIITLNIIVLRSAYGAVAELGLHYLKPGHHYLNARRISICFLP